MWSRLLTPIPYDRACRIRVNVLIAAIVGWALLVHWLLRVADAQGWAQLQGKKLSFAWFGATWAGAGLLGIAFCRTSVARQMHRQANPNAIQRLLRKLEFGRPRMEINYRTHLAMTLFGAIAACAIGTVVLVTSLS